jgi:hypothetical protein
MLPQTARIPLDGVADDLELAAQITYPYRQWLGAGGKTELAARMNVELGPHDVMVVETTPLRSHREPILAGCRYALASLEPGLMVCDVFTDAGEPVAFEILGSATVTGLDVEGQRVSGEGKRCLLPPDGAPQPLLIFRLPDRTGEERDVVGRVDHVPLQTVRLDIPDEHEAVLRILTDDTKLHPPKVSVNSGGLFGGLPYGVCTGRGWTAYDLRLNPRDMNVVAWGFPKSDSPPNAKLWLLREWDLKRTRVRISYAAGGGNAMRPHLPTPFAGRQHEALCISDVLPAVTDKRPWTDEYAREASG